MAVRPCGFDLWNSTAIVGMDSMSGEVWRDEEEQYVAWHVCFLTDVHLEKYEIKQKNPFCGQDLFSSRCACVKKNKCGQDFYCFAQARSCLHNICRKKIITKLWRGPIISCVSCGGWKNLRKFLSLICAWYKYSQIGQPFTLNLNNILENEHAVYLYWCIIQL